MIFNMKFRKIYFKLYRHKIEKMYEEIFKIFFIIMLQNNLSETPQTAELVPIDLSLPYNAH